MSLVTLSNGQMAYGSYVFPRSFVLTSDQLTNDIETTDLPFAPGSFSTSKPGTRLLTISGVLGGSGAILNQAGQQMLTNDQVKAELDLLKGQIFAAGAGDLPFQFTYDRFCYARMSQPNITYQPGGGYRFAEVDVSFIASDPRSYSFTQHSFNVQCLSGGGGAGYYPFSNAGNANAYPVITLTFQATTANPYFAFSHAYGFGGSQITLALLGTFLTTDTVVINTDPRARSITKNGVKTYSILSLPIGNSYPAGSEGASELFPFIEANTTTANCAIYAGSGQVTMNVAWNDTWL